MRPIRLRMTAFGPYASTETVDFRKALDGRLFGIYGPTGAGKTSILDGICFALFGESSGAERQGADLRSHHATAEVETEVQLVFDLGPRRYNVVRRPTQTVAAKRGGGVTTRQHFAAIYDATGLDLEAITDDVPGTVLAERKVETVADKLTELLGYKADQFRQVVLLPQGQFRKLLTAKSDERASVLRGLFDVSIYECFVERLKSDAATLRTKVNNARLKIEGRLQAHQAIDLTGLCDMLAAARTKAESLEDQRRTSERERDAARAGLASARQIEKLFEEYDAAEAEWTKIEAETPRIDALRSRARAAAAAKTLQPLNKSAVDARKAFDDSHEEEVDRTKAAENAASAYAEALLTLQTFNDRDEERVVAQREVIRLEDYGSRLENARPIRKRLVDAGRVLTTCKTKLNTAALAVEDAAKRVQAEESALQNARAAHERLNLARLSDATLKAEESAAHAYEVQARKVADLVKRVESAKDEADKAALILAGAKSAEVDAEGAMSAAQAVHLARKLAAGEPCPVCGSFDHPAPAHEPLAGEGLDQAFRVARAAREAAEAEDRKASDRFAGSLGAHDQANETLARLPVPSRTMRDVLADRDKLSVEVADLEILADVAKAQSDLERASSAKARADSHHASLTTAHSEAQTEHAAAASALETALAEVPEHLHAPEVLATQLQDARNHAQNLVETYQTAIDAERELDSALQAAKAKLSTVQALTRDRKKQSERAQAGFESALRESGLNLSAFAAAQPDIPDVDALGQKIAGFDLGRASAEGRRERALKAIEGQARPDIATLSTQADDADHRISEFDGAVAAHGALIAALDASLQDVRVLQSEADEASDAFKIVGELADLSDGKNAQKLRLRDYAIAATFEAVLDAANIRFSKMSQKRFTLLRKQEVADGRARSGLDIAVYDAHTDQFRDAHTLSGGEGFLASLSLALGLSDIVQHEAGGVRLDAIFIDEGFGHLDDETLDSALTALRELVGADRAVGVISHVDAVKQQIPLGFDVHATLRGSVVVQRLAA